MIDDVLANDWEKAHGAAEKAIVDSELLGPVVSLADIGLIRSVVTAALNAAAPFLLAGVKTENELLRDEIAAMGRKIAKLYAVVGLTREIAAYIPKGWPPPESRWSRLHEALTTLDAGARKKEDESDPA